MSLNGIKNRAKMKCRKKRLKILEKYCANLIFVTDIQLLQVCYFKVFYCHAAEAVFYGDAVESPETVRR